MSIRNKLRSQSGASLFLAILFFLVCMTVGGAILAAATVSAGRLRDQRQTQQDYLTVSSAARLLQEELGGVVFTGQTIVKTTTTYDEDGSLISHSSNTKYAYKLDCGKNDYEVASNSTASDMVPDMVPDRVPAPFYTVLKDAIDVYQSNPSLSDAKITVDADITGDANGFDTVSGKLRMNNESNTNKKYELTLTFYIGEGEETAESKGSTIQRSPMTLTLPAMVPKSPTKTTDISWSKDGLSETVTTIETTTVTWENGTITKGIAKGASI